jgi:hypothetical protein
MTRLAARQAPGAARAIAGDPRYLPVEARPHKGREDGAAGSVSGPFGFMRWTMELCARAVVPKGIVIVFCMGERSH